MLVTNRNSGLVSVRISVQLTTMANSVQVRTSSPDVTSRTCHEGRQAVYQDSRSGTTLRCRERQDTSWKSTRLTCFRRFLHRDIFCNHLTSFTMLSVGQLLWASFRPLIRLCAISLRECQCLSNSTLCFRVLCVACGFVITKSDNFPAIAARGAGQIMLNIALPCLMFSKIVPAFTSDNVGALGESYLSTPFHGNC
jgi:hypothetical protein